MTLGATQIQAIVDATKTPTAEQVRVIEAPRRPLLVVAGAGSGKTETMSMRVLWLLANHPDLTPASILGLTFTRKAAGELGDRLRERIRLLSRELPQMRERLDEDPVTLTYNSFAERIVSEHGMRIGIDPDFSMLSEAGALDMMTQIVEAWPTDLDDDLSPAGVVGRILHLAGEIAEHGYTVEGARQALEGFEWELEIVGDSNKAARDLHQANQRRIAFLGPIEAYQKRKREMGLLDFSDQLVLATRIVREVPSVRAALREEFRAVLLDEFQDTSVIQMELLSTLFGDHAVTAVGDPNQAIYGWRGASASSLETFLERFQTGAPEEGQTLTLSTAWRNDVSILEAANRVAEPLREVASYQEGKEQLNAQSPVLVPRPGAGRGVVEIAYPAAYEDALAATVDFVRRVRSRSRKDGSRRSVAVLSRRRKDFPLIDAALREAGIPTEIVGLGGLLDQPAVQDVRAALELGYDVAASPWLARLLAGIDLGAADLMALGDWARVLARREGASSHQAVLLDAVDEPPAPGWAAKGRPAISEEAVRRVRLLGERLRQVREGVGRSITEQVERAILIMGTLDDVIADPLSMGGRAALDEFIAVAAAYEKETPGASLGSFLAYLRMADEREDGLDAPLGEPDPKAVQILTVHGSKGLEWDGVVVFGLCDGVFPSHSKKTSVEWTKDVPPANAWLTDSGALPHPLRGDHRDLPPFVPVVEGSRTASAGYDKWATKVYKPSVGVYAEREERRLAYVAMTRARSAQLLVGSWTSDFNRKVAHPSRYLMEASAQLFGHAPQPAEGTAGAVEDRDVWGSGAWRDLGVEPAVGEGACLIAPIPGEEEREALSASAPSETFPSAPGPSRQRVAAAAASVRAQIRELAQDRDVFKALAELGDDPAVRDTIALIEEDRLGREAPVVDLWAERVPATSVSSLLQDAGEFARDMRRPMPVKPSSFSALGTVFHAWAERELHLAGSDPVSEAVDPSAVTSGEDVALAGGDDGADEALLTARERELLEGLRENFRAFVAGELADYRAVAIEEAFSVQVGGVSVQGRIDAVFERVSGQGPRFLVVDWKSGQPVTRTTKPEKLAYFATQLRLYQRAWAERVGVDAAEVGAMVAFLAGPSHYTLQALEGMLGGAAQPLDQAVKGALGQ
ncbi:ATP-dependent DNA helicase [Actinomyces bouchesdurhonensis]|uniref:ATP-dependent DNA helicase n=1 Tax=Actinomyces bouchesdurhonensis TaxID=1852361 RepID=UPI00093D7889|nr:ATP-dependent DNA helicase [Actinomyces bouchesdurhonensis]